MTATLTRLAAAERAALSAEAAMRPRRRLNRNLHADLADPVQRLLNAVEPGTYVRPHRHHPGVWELFTVLSGAAAVLTFEADGTVAARLELALGDVVEIPQGAWHSLISLAPETVLLEVKPGPYGVHGEKNFAAWAPPEGDPAAAAAVAWLERAQPGMRWV